MLDTEIYVNNLIKIVLDLHKDLENKLIMRKGIHDLNMIKSAISEPFQTFGGQDLYPNPVDKAAKICYNLAKDHGFVDGNKRTGLHAMLSYLDMNHITLSYSQEELENIVVDLVENKISLEKFEEWIIYRVTSKTKIENTHIKTSPQPPAPQGWER